MWNIQGAKMWYNALLLFQSKYNTDEKATQTQSNEVDSRP